MKIDLKVKKALKELIKLRIDNHIEIDEKYIYLLLEIINSSSIFPEKIEAIYSKSTRSMTADYETLNITYNVEGFKKDFRKSYELHKRNYFEYDLDKFYQYWFPFALIHEVSHIYQLFCARDSISEYDEVNELQKKVYNAFNNFRVIDRLIYESEFFHDIYCIERNANIIAANLLADIFEGTELEYYSRLVNINKLLSKGYILKGEKVISPVERTFKYLRIKDKVEEVNLPFEVLFKHGFKIKDEDFHYIYDVLAEGKTIDYDETINKIKTLIKRDNENFIPRNKK